MYTLVFHAIPIVQILFDIGIGYLAVSRVMQLIKRTSN